ncbi:MAG: SCO family protein [Bacteroidota bacterium]
MNTASPKLFVFFISCFFSLFGLSLYSCLEVVQAESRTAFLPYYEDASFTPKWLYPGMEAIQQLHQIPAFSLTNQEGEAFTEGDLSGKIYVADFFFTTCPGICPKMTANMSVLQEAFLDDPEIMLVSHSVTPELDSVEVLQRYAEEKGVISGKWQLLTGDREVIYDLGRNQYFVEEDLGLEKDLDDFLHTENFVLIDKNRNIRGIYNGLNKTAVRQLITDVKTLKEEF